MIELMYDPFCSRRSITRIRGRAAACVIIAVVTLSAAGCGRETPDTSTDVVSDQPAATVAEVSPGPPVVEPLASALRIPDAVLINQLGEEVQLRSLTDGNVVALNFLFTKCKGICPPMGANFGTLRKTLSKNGGSDIQLISITVDPVVDTPERLRAWSGPFSDLPGWALLTGEKQQIDTVLQELEVFTADKNDHSPFILFGDQKTGKWQRVHGLTSVESLAELLLKLQAARGDLAGNSTAANHVSDAESESFAVSTVADGDRSAESLPTEAASLPDTKAAPPVQSLPEDPTTESAALRYFTDVKLVNQHGQELRLYNDLIKGRVVVIHTFFTSCKGACPKLVAAVAALQDRFGDQLQLVSVTVDPSNDTPSKLATYADQFKARPGWHFVTGEARNVEFALQKIGQFTTDIDKHSNVFIIGNDKTGLWKKAHGTAPVAELALIVQSVLDDSGAEVETP